jgi:predicted nucleic acid-binding protein
LAHRAAVNASPLILLARGGLIQLLKLAGPEVIVPLPVAEEVRRRGSSDPTARALGENPWLVVSDIAVPPLVQAWDLGLGESSVLAWGHAHPGTLVVLDDLAARRCAATLGIPVRGTLGLVILAKQRGEIRAARPLLEALRRGGLYLSDSVLNAALALVGE